MSPAPRPVVVSALTDLASEGEIELAVRGVSMAPLFGDPDRVRIRRDGRFRAGDLLVFRNSAGDLVLHRLLGRRRYRGQSLLVLRGDAAPRVDGLVAEADVVGRVVGLAARPGAYRVPLRDRFRARLRFALYWLTLLVR